MSLISDNLYGVLPLFLHGSWQPLLHAEMDKPYFKSLIKFLNADQQVIYPPKELVFNAFNLCTFDSLRVVIIGQDPYHNPGQAMGLAFSVPKGVNIPSSLRNIYKEIIAEYKQSEVCEVPKHGDLSNWARQGVLLLNATLTVRKNQPASHSKAGWNKFTDALLKKLSDKHPKGLVFLLWGNHAQTKAKLIDTNKHYILKTTHPSGLSAHKGFFGCGHFKECNRLLVENGKQPINWLDL